MTLEGRLEPAELYCGADEMIAVIGPNGAGKTSLLRAIAGIEISSGQVRISGEDVVRSPPARRMRLLSFLPATRSLIWPIAVRDLIALGLPSPDEPRIDELVDALELHELAQRPVNHLSTGERSRVLLARALAARPRLSLLDEPLSNLDPYWVLKTLDILRSETRANGSAVLTSVHDLNQVRAFDRVILLNQGRLVADGEPGDILASAALAEAFRIEKAGCAWRIREGA
jgi:iron complex transport system ATP-binding protein